jgi:hypothetical protein
MRHDLCVTAVKRATHASYTLLSMASVSLKLLMVPLHPLVIWLMMIRLCIPSFLARCCPKM